MANPTSALIEAIHERLSDAVVIDSGGSFVPVYSNEPAQTDKLPYISIGTAASRRTVTGHVVSVQVDLYARTRSEAEYGKFDVTRLLVGTVSAPSNLPDRHGYSFTFGQEELSDTIQDPPDGGEKPAYHAVMQIRFRVMKTA